MNLIQTERLLSDQTQEYLKTVYRGSKITGSVQINFIAAQLSLPQAAAAVTAQFLQQVGMVVYEKYGRISLTDAGQKYVRTLLDAEQNRRRQT